MQFGIGQSVLRVEDRRLVRGQGNYTGDLDLPGAAWLQVVRSPHAHARVLSLATDAARAAPGVLAVLTAEDLREEGFGSPTIDFFGIEGGAYRHREGTGLFMPDNALLASDRVRHVGEAIALVVAETDPQARDAAALVEVAFEPLPAVVDLAAALEPGAPIVWEGAQGNLCADVDYGDEAATDEVFAAASHVVTIEAVNNRVIINPMEPRGAAATFDPATGRFTVHATTQMPHRAKTMLAEQIMNLPRETVRVVCRDMGGGFGTRGAPIPECFYVAWCARRTGRPVKWTCERSEGFVSDPHGRDNSSAAALALDARGRFLALKVDTIANLGAYPGGIGPMVPVVLGPRVQTGIYDIPVLHARIRVAYTAAAPCGAILLM